MVLPDFKVSALTAIFIQQHSLSLVHTDAKGYMDLHPENIAINYASFTALRNDPNFPGVEIALREDILTLSCTCADGWATGDAGRTTAAAGKLCPHQAQALYNIAYRDELRIFFDPVLRLERLRPFAVPYGLGGEADLEAFFYIEYHNRKAVIKPLSPGLLPVTPDSTAQLQQQLLPPSAVPLPGKISPLENGELFIVFKQHKYYKHLCIDVCRATATRTGKIKNPVSPLDPLDFIWTSDNAQAVKFFTGITRFQNNHTTHKSDAGIEALKAIGKNPLNLRFYLHDSTASENIVAGSVHPVSMGEAIKDLSIFVSEKGNFYAISGQITIDGRPLEIKELDITADYFIRRDDTLHLIPTLHCLKVMEFFRSRPQGILIHASKFSEFRQQILAPLEDSIRITYAYLQAATREQREESGLNNPPEKIIYLSDAGNHVLLDPVMKYGMTEIPLFSRKQIYLQGPGKKPFTLERDLEAENQFFALLLRQHPHFGEQLEEGLTYFYLHKDRFLDEDWFLTAFEQWKDQGITVLGFNQLKGNKLSPHKVNITIHVKSGLNWFNTVINVRFGKQKVNVSHLHQSIRNKNRFVQLDDGTQGILPGEWLEKFTAWFNAGQVIDGELLTPKINFSSVARLYDPGLMDEDVRMELEEYQAKFAAFGQIKDIPVPEGLTGTLRHYQKEGLNWLNFLDDFNFGGCLADDMGLGKSIQVIAFILSQRAKTPRNTNLIVVPTSLIFNWQQEVRKFAPSILIHTVYGAERIKNTAELNQYEIVLTSYGTLFSDITFLRDYPFNYIFLDESQNIKNPDSQRYHTVRQLTSRNKIVLTGTPIENNTLDLYGQLSFACPGLLGSKQYFRDVYSIPIDRFKDSKRAVELQNKVQPFILRRTKQQVARELPEKIEMVLHCPMGEKQRAVYELYEKGFRDFLLSGSSEDFPQSTMHVLKGLTRLRQICNSPVLLDDENRYDDSSSKIDILMEQVENLVPDHKILIFSQFVSMLNLIRQELITRKISFQYLTGATRDRASVVSDFQENDTVRVFLISLKAGGTGLNLTGADYVFLVDPWWNPAVENQAIDRSYRMGQTNNVVAVRLICPDTIEEKIMQLQDTKKELVNDLIKTDTALFKSLTREGLLSLLKSIK
jgi:hypothetical protein